MYRVLNISHHRHTGRRLPRQHTSYASLAFMLMLTGILLAGTSVSSFAASTPPAAGSVGLSGKMPATAPKTAPTITSPVSGLTVSSTPITVSGICATDTIVEVFKNDIFAGASNCGADKTFAILTDLLFGSNNLIARAYDALDQASPDSNAVSVFYNGQLPGISSIDGSNTLGQQLVLHTSAVFRGIEPNQQLAIPLDIIGGTAPFSLSFNWGDGGQDLVTRSDNVSFSTYHAYKRPGTFQVTIKASDIRGQSAMLTTIVIVNGPSQVMASTTNGAAPTGIDSKLLILWPLYLLAIVAVISYWLGEKREKHYLIHLAA